MSEKIPVSEPIVAHDDTAHGATTYEVRDVKAGIVVWSLIIVAGLVAGGFVLMIGMQKYLEYSHPVGELASPLSPDRVLAPAPQLQIHPWEDIPELRENEEKALNTTGRDAAGRMHIPIASAMTEVLSRLKQEPNAPHGLTTPGGQGREYSRSITEIPGTARPRIEGEVRKNAR